MKIFLSFNQIFNSLLGLGWFFLSLALFLKHTKALEWLGFIFMFLSFIIFPKVIKSSNLEFIASFFKKFKILIVLLGTFLVSLFWFVIISPYPQASIEAFLLNYFFHIIVFLVFIFLSYFKDFTQNSFFWIILGLSVVFSISYHLAFVLYKCEFNLKCFLSSSFVYISESLLKGVVTTSAPLVFSFFMFLGLFKENLSKQRFIYLILSLISLIFLVYIGRRAALLGIFTGYLILLVFSENQILKRYFLAIIVLIIILTTGFLLTPYGKIIMINSRDNLTLLFSKDPENWAKSGSMGMRLYIWPIYLKKSLEEPFSGTGLGRKVQKKVLSETNKKALSLEHSHNLFLNLALQAGWHTALLFLVFNIWTLKKAYCLWKLSNENFFMASLFLFLISFLIMSFLEGMEEGTRFTTFWIAAGLVWGYEQKYREKDSFSS